MNISSKVHVKQQETIKFGGDLCQDTFIIGPEIIGIVTQVYHNMIQVKFQVIPGLCLHILVHKDHLTEI